MEEDSFTKAAERRFVTQPAFSRRIRLLEDWLGIKLVERQRKPISILPAVREHDSEIRELVGRFYQLRNNLQNSSRQDCAVFVVQHTLAISHFPALIKQIQSKMAYQSYRLHTANNEDCPAAFNRSAQYMLYYELCYENSDHRMLRSENNLSRRVLDHEQLIPVIEPALYDRLFGADITADANPESLPALMYPKDSFLSEALSNSCLPDVMRHYSLEVICESAFALSLKEMVLAGMGIAWLPEKLISQELENKRLIALGHTLGECTLLVCLYQFSTESV